MKIFIRKLLLFTPLFWLGFVFILLMLNSSFDSTIIYDNYVDYYGDGYKPSGFISYGFILFITFFFIVPNVFINIIYCAHKKQWGWFWGYVLIVGIILGVIKLSAIWG